MSRHQGPLASRRPIPFARGGDGARMHMNITCRTAGGVDIRELDRLVAQMYRDVANVGSRGLHFPTGRPLAGALGYPADLLGWLPAEAVRSFAGVGYDLGLVRLRSGERVLDLGSERVSYRRARIEELPFDNDSFDAAISNVVVNLHAAKPKLSAEAARVLRPGGGHALSDIVTDRQIATRTGARPTAGPPASREPASEISTSPTSRPPASRCR